LSEERIIPDAAEFASAASGATVFWTNVFQSLLVAAVVLWVLDIPRSVFGIGFYTEQFLTICLGLTLALAYLANTSRPRTILDWVAVIASVALCGYIALRYEHLTLDAAFLPLDALIVSILLIVLIAEASRRTNGWGFVSMIAGIAVYVYISPHLPGDFQTRYVSPGRMITYVGLDLNGAIGNILQVAVLVVIPFTILGQVLARTGGADFFADISMAAMGRFRGGAAKIAVVGSALFGMISGSAVSNVLAVGIVTIPTMVKSGFTPHRSAAIESVGSTGGQLMPPVMGASAFIMAEFLQVPYGSVCIAAAIPALLYYLCLFFHVDLEAAKHRIGAAKIAEAPAVSEVLKSGWHFLVPIAFLVFALMYPELSNLTPEKAAIYSTAILIVLAMIFGYRGKRLGIIGMLNAIMETGRVSLDIILIGAAAGIMVGIMSISGLAFSMTIQLLALAAGNIFLLLLLIAVLAFILGIGLPTVSVYILTATLLAPALVKLGVTPMAAHMFVMYNGILSMITPPVAFAAYAAANIARTDGWTTGWMACVVGWSTFILPLLFVLTPSLLMDGSWTEIVLNFSRVTFGIWLGTIAAVGFSFARLNPVGRAIYAAISLAVVLPPETFPGAIWINVAGVTAAIVFLAIDWMRGKKGTAKMPATPY
jgi:TRAP transporter 4TM/12TM fusion protein